MSNNKNKKPWFERDALVALAPMEAITDLAYRSIVRSVAPDAILYTEFANARGLLYEAKKVWQMAEFEDSERPLIIQIYDSLPEAIGEATGQIVKRHRPDGIDLNMGCPVRKVANRGAGCGMMDTPEVAAESVKQMVANADGVPVSIKTRLGIRSKTQVIEVVQACIEAGAVQATIHARLKSDRPRVPADFEALEFAAKQLNVPIIGNGDVWTEADAVKMVSLEGVSGAMIGRGGIGNPWLLQRCIQAIRGEEVDPLPNREERARIAILHLRKNVEFKGERRGVLEMRKVVRNYIKGYLDSKHTWMKLVNTETEAETIRILEDFGRGRDDLYADRNTSAGPA